MSKNKLIQVIATCSQAAALTFGQDPAMIYFGQEKMRQDVINCFEIGHISLFPTHAWSPKPTETYLLYLPSHCMIQCFSGKEWFHKSCLSVLSKFIHNKKNLSAWNCQSCAGNC